MTVKPRHTTTKRRHSASDRHENHLAQVAAAERELREALEVREDIRAGGTVIPTVGTRS